MKKLILSTLVASTILLSSGPSWAKVEFPAPSPGAKISQKVGLGTVDVEYSRPGLKGREIFGEQVPYGTLWRTGANAPTTITFSEDVSIKGTKVPAGRYSLFSIPEKNEWTVILNTDGAVKDVGAYDQSKDLARFKVKPETREHTVESFTIGFDDLRDDSFTLFMDWGNIRVPLAVSLNTKETVMSQIKKDMFDGTEKTAGEYASAAFYLYSNGGDLEQALEWMNTSIEKDPKFYLVHRKALILAKLGRNAEAKEAAMQSIKMAESVPSRKDEYTYLNQQLIDSLK